MKKIKNNTLFASAMLLILILSMQPAMAEEPGSTEPVLDTTRLWVNYNYALVPTEKIKVSMDALITYVGDLGEDTTQLEAYKADFVAKQDDMLAVAENNEPLGQVISEMRAVVKGFRDEVASLVGENKTDAREAVRVALEENEDIFHEMIAEARTVHKAHNLEAFDHMIDKAQERIDDGAEKGLDTTEVQEALDEIKARRDQWVTTMDDAIESCTVKPVIHCNTTETDEYRALKVEIRQDFKDIRELAKNVGKQQRIAVAIAQARDVVVKTQERLNNANVDVSEFQESLDEISGMIDSAEENNNAKGYDGAIENLNAAREMFRQMRQSSITKRNSAISLNVKSGVGAE